MGYTPVELRHVSVRRRLFGYDRRCVQQILDEVAESFETVWRDRGELADKVEALEHEAEELRQREQTLSNTLVTAERVADEVREQAKREAGLILMDARGEAREILRAAQDERDRLQADVRRIEALLRSALGVLGEAREVHATSVPVEPSAEPFSPALETEPEASHEHEASASAAASDSPHAPDLAPDAPADDDVDDHAELENAPGWPPLKEVAQGSSRFDWGD